MSESTIGADHTDEVPAAPESVEREQERVEQEQRANPIDMGHQPAYIGIPPTAWGPGGTATMQTGEGDPIGYPVEDPWWVHKALNEAERLVAMPGAAVPGVLGHEVLRWALIAQTDHVRVYFTVCGECGDEGFVIVRNPWAPTDAPDSRWTPEFFGPMFQRRCRWEGT